MALKIRLSRAGSKKRPFYRIVIAEATAPRDGRFVEKVGTYNPMVPHENPTRIVLEADRIRHWLSVGAQPTDRVARFLGKADIIAMPEIRQTPLKSTPGKKAQERMKEKEAAVAAAATATTVVETPPVVEEAPSVAVAEAPAPVETPVDAEVSA